MLQTRPAVCAECRDARLEGERAARLSYQSELIYGVCLCVPMF